MGRRAGKEVIQISRHALFLPLLLLCIAGVFIGFWYYQTQLSATSLPLLIFVPDCPLYVLLTLPLLLGLIRSSSFSFLVAIGMAKYGLWTVFVLLFHSSYYFQQDFLPITIVFIIGHTGMAILGCALLSKKRVGVGAFSLSLAWFLLNDFADYFVGTVPPIPLSGMEAVKYLTIAASIAITFAFFVYNQKIRNLPVVKTFREIIGN